MYLIIINYIWSVPLYSIYMDIFPLPSFLRRLMEMLFLVFAILAPSVLLRVQAQSQTGMHIFLIINSTPFLIYLSNDMLDLNLMSFCFYDN